MDDEEDWLTGSWLPGRWGAIIRGIGLIAMLIALSCVGFWQVFVIVADHWGGKPGDGGVRHGL
jgi:hypothetical protein